jgi:hypothetical protein
MASFGNDSSDADALKQTIIDSANESAELLCEDCTREDIFSGYSKEYVKQIRCGKGDKSVNLTVQCYSTKTKGSSIRRFKAVIHLGSKVSPSEVLQFFTNNEHRMTWDRNLVCMLGF